MELPAHGALCAIEEALDALPPAERPAEPVPMHELLMLWIIEHPAEPLKNAAGIFGVRPQWIYNITSSSLFKARLQEVMREKGITRIIAGLREKIEGTTELALDKLGEKLADSEDPRFIHEVAKTLLNPQRGAQVAVHTQVQVNFEVDARVAAVAASRQRMLERARLELAERPVLEPGDILRSHTTQAGLLETDEAAG